MGTPILETRGIQKEFPGVKALSDVSFSVGKGEVRALVGENGAGKSTLMKILNGVYTADAGEILIEGEGVTIENPLSAQRQGLAIIFQEFNLVPMLSVAENIYLGRLGGSRKTIEWNRIFEDAGALLEELNYDIDPRELVENLSVAQKQMVEIAKAISFHSKIIVMDEPSAVLTENELQKLFEIVDGLKKSGITVIYISHRLEEIFRICDSVTVMRDGRIIDTSPIEDLTKEQIIEKMIGRKIDQEYPTRDTVPGEVVLRATGLNRGRKVRGVSLELRRGEVLGLSGLVGAGRTETVRLLFGADEMRGGSIEIGGAPRRIRSPIEAKKAGIALLPEDRKQQGLLLDLPITQNITVVNLDNVKAGGARVLSKSKEREAARHYFEALQIKAPSVTQKVFFLSGGNQQKVVIAKWLFSEADILIWDEPTRGIDVGAKYEIYLLMNELVAQGKSIILISSEMNEIVAMCDRVLVMREGEVRAELAGDEIKAETVLKYAIG